MFDFAKPNSLFTQMCISFFRDDLDVESGKSQSKKKKKENKTNYTKKLKCCREPSNDYSFTVLVPSNF
jgi:hypothetical protein